MSEEECEGEGERERLVGRGREGGGKNCTNQIHQMAHVHEI